MPGYKHTEVGVIPKDWNISKLGDTCKFENGDRGRNYPSRSSFSASGVPFINAGHVTDGRILQEKLDYIPRDRFDILGGGKIEPGDILFCLRGSLGKFGVVGSDLLEGAIASSLIIIRPKTAQLCRKFLVSYFKSPYCTQMVEKWAGGAAQPNLGGQDLARFLIPLPPALPEQEAIATALSDADALIEALEQLIAKKRHIKQGAMQELLTGKKRLPGFSGKWEVKRVAELGEVVTGGTPRTDVGAFWGGEYPWITPTDISTHRDMFASERFVTQKGLNAIRALPVDTVLVTCIASIGKNAILKAPGGCNQQINAVIPNKDNRSEFLYYIFETSKQYLLANAGTTATSIISKMIFQQLTFKVPSLPEQVTIATVLSDMDAEIVALETKLTKTHQIKQGMMHELLTGRIRLI